MAGFNPYRRKDVLSDPEDANSALTQVAARALGFVMELSVTETVPEVAVTTKIDGEGDK